MGYFVADGSYYKDGRSNRFEFSDGSSIKEELHYSHEFLEKLRKLIKNIFNINPPELRKRENRYVLSFRNRFVESILKKNFNLKPGKKALSIKVPSIYKNNKFFWIGLMDGDGMVARDSRKIALCTVNVNIINNFKRFLKRNKIEFKYREDYPFKTSYSSINKRYTVTICAAFFNEYASKIGFLHPRKKLWLIRHLKKKNCFIKNIIVKKDIDYLKIFNKKNIYIENGKEILKSFGLINYGIKNKKFIAIFNALKKIGIERSDILNILLKYRWKLSKGSKNSVKLPKYINKDVLEIAKFIRLGDSSINISKGYIKSHNKDPNILIKKLERIFDISPKYTKKGKLIYCSGILNILFSHIIKRDNKEYKALNLEQLILK